MPKYIDFDALGVGMCNPDVFENKGYAEGWNSLIKILHDAPAADVEPVRHGSWIWDDEGFHCSECWFHAYGDTGEVLSGHYHYCPNCGSRMLHEPPKEEDPV